MRIIKLSIEGHWGWDVITAFALVIGKQLILISNASLTSPPLFSEIYLRDIQISAIIKTNSIEFYSLVWQLFKVAALNYSAMFF